MKFEYLREFIVAARSQELQQAAAELGISLSSLSKHLKSLELEIGAPLFVRARRTVLSHYGRILLPYAQELVALQDEYRADFSGGVSSSGELTVALSSIQFRERSGQVIEEFMLTNPSVLLHTVEFGNSELCEQLLSGRCDVAFIRSQPTLERDPALVYYPFCSDRLVAFLPPEHPLAAAESLGFEQLRREKILLRSENSAIARVVKRECAALGFEPEIGYVSSFAIYDMVRRGEGISLYLAQPVSHDYGMPLAIVPVEPPVVSCMDVVVRREPLSPPAEAFLRFVLERALTQNARL